MPGYSAGPSGAVAEKSTVTGEGLTVGTTRQTSEFVITAKDAQGVRCTSGGESFFVFARGTARVRAYVTDNADGTYTVQWRVHSPQRATDSFFWIFLLRCPLLLCSSLLNSISAPPLSYSIGCLRSLSDEFLSYRLVLLPFCRRVNQGSTTSPCPLWASACPARPFRSSCFIRSPAPKTVR